MPGQGGANGFRLPIPDPHRPFLAAAANRLPICTHGDAGYSSLVRIPFLRGLRQSLALPVPQSDVSVLIPNGNQLAVPADGCGAGSYTPLLILVLLILSLSFPEIFALAITEPYHAEFEAENGLT